MGEDTPFPEREAFEWPYDLSSGYSRFFEAILDFARKLIAPDPSGKRKKRVQYWTALALLRGVMSSPEAGVKMLNTRLDRLAEAVPDSDAAVSEDAESENPIGDLDYGFEGDNAPTQVLEQGISGPSRSAARRHRWFRRAAGGTWRPAPRRSAPPARRPSRRVRPCPRAA